MPYATNEDLPPAVRDHLPPPAQHIFRAAFNGAYDEYSDDPRREEISFRVAWAAVEKRYWKAGANWEPIE
jgi:cation transport regulator